ncbi:MAG: hypothetical protein O2780_18390 [Proteobacteria bacterium]|nr:hypothetical protein [Pseudomonadota bacterium]MDA1302531.1 hypothetical protein [Pseudomonadota bacterium]
MRRQSNSPPLPLLRATVEHVTDTLGDVSAVEPWESTGIPVYLLDRYEFHTARILGKRCLLCLEMAGASETPARLKKHVHLIAEKFGGEVVYVTDNIKAYNRKRLIEQRVPFVVPRRQIYLPGFGIDLREQFSRMKSDKRSLGAVAQLLVLREIFRGDVAERQLGEWAEQLGYSAMTISRAIDELVTKQIAERHREGRTHSIAFLEKGEALWERSRDCMQSPVRKVVWAESMPSQYQAPLAGESALARYTLLSPPSVDTVAVFDRDKRMRRQLVELPDDAIAEASLRIERWRYDPRAVNEGPVVDELSLWLSLKGHEDERVQIAADQLLEQMRW